MRNYVKLLFTEGIAMGRESLRAVTDTKMHPDEWMPIVSYAADGSHIWSANDFRATWGWQRSFLPCIHMPRNYARIFLRVTDVRVERLNEISEEDAMAEIGGCGAGVLNSIGHFQELWESLHGPGSWSANPWVWVISFERAPTPANAGY